MKDFGEYLPPNISLKPSECYLQDFWSGGNQRTGFFFPYWEERELEREMKGGYDRSLVWRVGV